MGTLVLLSLSVVLQVFAAVLALRMIRITGRGWAWILIASALLLMAFRRAVSLSHLWSQPPDNTQILPESIALGISVIMLLGVAALGPVFAALRRSSTDLARLNRAYQMESACMRALLRARDENGLLHDACRIIVDVGGYRLAWVGLAELDPQKSVRPVAQAGYEHGYLDTVQITYADTARGRGPTGTAIRTRTPCVARRILADPNFAPWREEARKRGYVSSAALPLVTDSCVLGALSVYSADPDAFGSDELTLLMSLANNLAWGVEALRARLDRERAQEMLERERNLFRDGPVVAFRWQAREGWPVEYVSPNVIQFGYTAADFISTARLYASIVHPEDLPRILAEVVQHTASGASCFEQEYRIVRPDGEARWVYDFTMVLRGPNGVLDCYQGYVLDITERRRADEERERLAARLRQARKMEAIGTLAAGVAHDFNNFLTAMAGYSYLARRATTPGSKAMDALEAIEQVTERAAGVTQSLLTFSRESPSAKTPVHFGVLVDATIDMLRRMLPSSIEVMTEISPAGNLWVRADEVQIQQVLMNLAVNARDAMPDGGQLHVTVRHQPEAGGPGRASGAGSAALICADTGIGMAPDVCSRIFEPFFTTKARGQGTGLGLAVVHGIVTDHGGRIEVESAVGRGTRVTVTLPCCDPADVAVPAASDERIESGGGETLLLVEDDPLVRTTLAFSLCASGYQVVQASDGLEAMAAFAENPERIRLVVMDVDLPRKSGLACMEEMRARCSALPVVLVTGNVVAGLEEKLDARIRLLRKPFRVADLQSLLRELLASGPGCPAAGSP